MVEGLQREGRGDKGRLKYIGVGVLFVLIVVLDQWLKVYIKTHYTLGESTEVFSWFRLCFVENSGMAFGMNFIATWMLAGFRMLAVPVFVWLIIRTLRRGYPLGFVVCLTMIAAGALGNIIDNCFYGLGFSQSFPSHAYFKAEPAVWVGLGNGYAPFMHGKVVDMFYFPLFTWPDWVPLLGGKVFFNAIFNLADAAISCGAVAMLLFYSKYLLNSNR